MRTTLYRCFWYLAYLVILFGTLVSLTRFLTPTVARHRIDFEKIISNVSGIPIQIQSARATWYWWYPVIALEGVTLNPPNQKPIQIEHVMIGMNLPKSILARDWVPSLIVVDGFQEHISFLKQKAAVNKHQLFAALLPVMDFLGRDITIVLTHGTVNVNINARWTLLFENFYAKWKHDRHGNHLTVESLVNGTPFKTLFDVRALPKTWEEAEGSIYLKAVDISFSKWQSWIPLPYFFINKGIGDIELWLDMKQGAIVQWQSRFVLEHLQLTIQKIEKSIDKLSGDVLFKKTSDGFTLQGDNLNLVLDGAKQPSNRFYWRYQTITHQSEWYVQEVNAAIWYPWASSFFKKNMKSLPVNMEGIFRHVLIRFDEYSLIYALIQFQSFGFSSWQTYPDVHSLSGQLLWTPAEGQVQLDSQNVMISTPSWKHFLDRLELSCRWQSLVEGLRVDLLKSSIKSKDLNTSFYGDLSGRSKNHLGTLNLMGDVAMNHGEQWLSLLPKGYLSPAFYRWLTEDIKRLDHLSLHTVFRGALEDAPFDKTKKGFFYADATLSGVDLYFAPLWPLSKDLNATLHYAGRTLTAMINSGKLGEIPVNNIMLDVKHLGTSDTQLSVKGTIHTDAEYAQKYLKDSPLIKTLTWLKTSTLKGATDIILNITANLAEKNTPITVSGTSIFTNNYWVVHDGKISIPMKNINGRLLFSNKGLQYGTLKALLWDKPFDIKIKPLTMIEGFSMALNGTLTIQTLADIMPSWIWTKIKGSFPVQGELLWSKNAHDFDEIHLNTSLIGVSSGWSYPFQKNKDQALPSTFSLAYHPDEGVQATAIFNDNIVLKLKKTSWISEDYTLYVNHPWIQGDLKWMTKPFKVSGNLTRLSIPELPEDKKSSAFLSSLKIKDLPSISLKINEFRYHDILLGETDIEGERSKNLWLLKKAHINSQAFEGTLTGSWKKTQKAEETAFNISSETHHLDDVLTMFKSGGYAKARKAQLYFEGNCLKSPFDLNWSCLKGKMNVFVEQGTIMKLNESTEKKLDFGRFLGLLSLQSIPRRLRLDFSDVVDDGFGFDKAEGHFSVNDGKISTEDFYLSGSLATVLLQGDIDMIKKEYALILKISPDLTSGIPIIAAVTGGPIVGLAAFLASKIIYQTTKKVNVYTYSVTGPWSHPVVESVKAFRKGQFH